MTVARTHQGQAPPGLFDESAGRGTAVAVVTDEAEYTYSALSRMSAERAAEYPPVTTGRRLIGLVATNTIEFLVDYLAAHSAGHVVLLLPPDGAATDNLLAAWHPDVVAGDGRPLPAGVLTAPPRHDLHPDLALLLSTSGSTGAPKLVRQSRRAVLANARSIVDYLGIVPGDRAITTLPPHYCYGLSVLHSHLLAGASVVLNSDSVSAPAFWDRAEAGQVTTFAAVPHTVELLERVGLDRLDRLTRLRYLTQAGGRLAPEAVRRLAAHLEARGAELVVMYGQTEATARMAYLPPHLARTRAGAIGIAIPGGSFRVDRPRGTDPHAPGELVYRGPNVMMGYARTSADLARGPELDELRTGDLARIADDGLVEIVGRMGRETKIFGHRIDLGRVESTLADGGFDAWCVGEPDRLVVVTRERSRALASAAATASGLPTSAVEQVVVVDPPRTPAGKVDQAALRALVADRARTGAGADADAPSTLVAHALGLDSCPPDATFVDLGGDSLTYVVLSTRLEERVPGLPRDWHLRPLGELDTRAAGPRPPAASRWTPWRAWARVDTSVVLRALFILTIVGGHTRAFAVYGGAHVLVALTGYSLARFRLHSASARERARGVLTTVGRIAVPAVVWLLLVTPLTSRYHWYSPLLATHFLGPRSWSDDRWWNPWQMWFVEATVYLLLGVAALMAVPAVSRLDRRWPYALPATLVGLGLLVRYAVIDLGGGPLVWYSAPAVLWLFALGWAVARAEPGGAGPGGPGGPGGHRAALTAMWARLACSAVALVCVPGWFGDPGREVVIVGGVLALIWIPAVRLPRPVVRVVTPLAAASLFIYLTHFLVYPPIRDAGHPWPALVASLAVGVCVWWLWERGAGIARRVAARGGDADPARG
ncbi:acyl-CoA synthetase (AMP-forming)/AMP-acid ligase II [Dietzia kunjamensis]|uniref:AMP-binding protein n=2 Tax=Dietzia kunjamensis TaxID=322509 RepID=UPI000E724EF9|nr:AMP-binding protein [Dietzia kunjamensis]RKE55112.1 acyl-CoA synthetase (AMP-forming)/AMP-acid ligase II [Dietzia kunjamensis]